jgi:hypothetical protein
MTGETRVKRRSSEQAWNELKPGILEYFMDNYLKLQLISQITN